MIIQFHICENHTISLKLKINLQNIKRFINNMKKNKSITSYLYKKKSIS